MALAIDDRGSGDPLVLVHGLGTTRWIWEETSAQLSGLRRTLAPDLPGFGQSAPVGPRFEIEAVADAIAEEAWRRTQGPFDLLGHSLGGAVALTLASRQPDRVRRLILQAPAGFHPRPPRLAEGIAVLAPGALAAGGLLGGPVSKLDAGRRLLLWGAIHDPGRLTAEQVHRMLNASRGAVSLRDAARFAVAADLAGTLRDTDVPVGFIWGDSDPLMRPGTQEGLRTCRPQAPVGGIADAGHVAQLERPGEFAPAVERLLVTVS